MNREVENTGLQMTAEGIPFDIATKGTTVRHESILSSVKSEYQVGTSGTYANTGGVNGTYYTADSLRLRYDTGASKIGPDGSGELSLFIIPRSDSAIPVKITLNVVAFAKIEKYDANGDPIYVMNGSEYALDTSGNKIPETTVIEITNASDFASAAGAVHNTAVAGSASSYVQAADYLRGHIMFFGEKAALNAGYHYTAAYTTREINTTVAAGNEGKAVNIPINWMWTDTLGQIALKQADPKRHGNPIVQDLTNEQLSLTTTEKAKVINYVKDNKDSVLANWMGITLSASETTSLNALSTQIQESSSETLTNDEANALAKSQIVDNMIDNMDDASNFNRLSACYNTADRSIGTKVAYFVIEVSVESGS